VAIDLVPIADWPDFALPPLAFHEGSPGHHLQAMRLRETDLPALRRFMQVSAFTEGWAMLAEDTGAAHPAWRDDPVAQLGFLQSALFRAARLVVDTGIHHKRWSREEAVAYLAGATGLSTEAMAAEIDRYAVWPGQAAAYMLGRERFRQLFEDAERRLGPAFDPVGWRRVALGDGPRPFDVVEADIRSWADNLSPAAAPAPGG
jgi:uncharacterized protein (DUF885 family)